MIGRLLLAAVLISAPMGLAAQSTPEFDPANPRLQTVKWQQGEIVELVAMPQTAVTVVFELGEQVQTIELGNPGAFDVAIAAGGDGLLVTPLTLSAASGMSVTTQQREYTFDLRTGTGLTAAYLLRFTYADELAPEPVQTALPISEAAYRLKGDRNIRPQIITDDGERIYLQWGNEQPIPAVFSIGESGKEQVVNGHMRGDVFVVDRIHERLVFRIDKEKAAARRYTDGRRQ